MRTIVFLLLISPFVFTEIVRADDRAVQGHQPTGEVRQVVTVNSSLKTASATELVTLVEMSLGIRLATNQDLPDLKIEEIERRFLELPRDLPNAEVRELKYALIHWRKKMVEKLVRFSEEGSDSEFGDAMATLNTLAIELNPTQHVYLQARLEKTVDRTERARIYESFRHQEPLRPQHMKPTLVSGDPQYRIVPVRHVEKQDLGNPANGVVDQGDVKRWAPLTKLQLGEKNIIESAPDQGEGAYRFRSRMIIKPGDIILLEQNTDYCTDLNTSVSTPLSLFSHSAIFVEIEYGNPKEKLPAVLEVYTHGLRLVPVELYLGRRFSHYTEIHRSKQAQPDWAAKLRKITTRYSQELDQWRYDFYAKEFQRRDSNREKTANCASLPSHVFIELGIAPISARCDVDKSVLPLTTAVGLPFTKCLTCTDYRRDNSLELVGVVDSGDLEAVLSQELVVRNHSLSHTASGHFASRDWDESKMPAAYFASEKLLSNFYGGTWGAEWAVNRSTEWPWTKKNFPNAPPKTLAFITTVEPEIRKAMHGLRNDILTDTFFPELRPAVTARPRLSQERSRGAKSIVEAIERGKNGHRYLSLQELEKDSNIQRDIADRLQALRQWFNERKSP